MRRHLSTNTYIELPVGVLVYFQKRSQNSSAWVLLILLLTQNYHCHAFVPSEGKVSEEHGCRRKSKKIENMELLLRLSKLFLVFLFCVLISFKIDLEFVKWKIQK